MPGIQALIADIQVFLGIIVLSYRYKMSDKIGFNIQSLDTIRAIKLFSKFSPLCLGIFILIFFVEKRKCNYFI